MSYSARSLERIAKTISRKIEDELDRVGIFHRTFYRCKKEESVESKIVNKNYDGKSTFLRDIIGIRTNLYFADDIEIIYPYFKDYFDFVEEAKDINIETEFKPTRLNIVFRIIREFQKEFRDVVQEKRIDNTFEFQIRTVFSEGWHEVDHDLRYKCKSDWDNHQDLGRMFNGVFAGLEASDWAIIQIFENLAYRHYKNNLIDSMIRSKFRIRLVRSELNQDVNQVINSDINLQKAIFKIDRQEFLSKFLESNVIMPITIDNLIFFLNHVFLNDKKLIPLIPTQLAREFSAIKFGL
jgi:ppGpp synthetase/RelA/SpoT-type nucleotidyltranferase